MGRSHRLPGLGHPRDVPARARGLRSGRVDARKHPPGPAGLGLPQAARRAAGSRAIGRAGSDRACLSPAQVTRQLEATAPKTVRGRARTPALLRRHASLTSTGRSAKNGRSATSSTPSTCATCGCTASTPPAQASPPPAAPGSPCPAAAGDPRPPGKPPEPADISATVTTRARKLQKPESLSAIPVSRGVTSSKQITYGSFSYTATWLWLSEVNGARSHPAQRSRSRNPAILAIRSSSEGQT